MRSGVGRMRVFVSSMKHETHSFVASRTDLAAFRNRDYVLGDARMTAEIVQAILAAGEVRWITQRGKPSGVPMRKLRTVEDCMRDPMPDQSWMDEPMGQERFCGWLESG